MSEKKGAAFTLFKIALAIIVLLVVCIVTYRLILNPLDRREFVDGVAIEGPIWLVKGLLVLEPTIDEKNRSGNTLLMTACDVGRLDLVRLLIEKGADVNKKNKLGETALILASEAGYTDVARLLLDKGADINPKSKSGTALVAATWNGRMETVKFLMEKGVSDVSDAFLAACHRGFAPFVKYFVEEAKIKATTDQITSGLLLAARFQHVPVVQYLLNKGADVNGKSQGGRTPLMEAAMGSIALNDAYFKVSAKPELIELFIKKGADVNVIDQRGRTALMGAAWRGHIEIIKSLLNNGALQDRKDKDGKTALDYAKGKGHKEAAKLLENAKSKG